MHILGAIANYSLLSKVTIIRIFIDLVMVSLHSSWWRIYVIHYFLWSIFYRLSHYFHVCCWMEFRVCHFPTRNQTAAKSGECFCSEHLLQSNSYLEYRTRARLTFEFMRTKYTNCRILEYVMHWIPIEFQRNTYFQ